MKPSENHPVCSIYLFIVLSITKYLFLFVIHIIYDSINFYIIIFLSMILWVVHPHGFFSCIYLYSILPYWKYTKI